MHAYMICLILRRDEIIDDMILKRRSEMLLKDGELIIILFSTNSVHFPFYLDLHTFSISEIDRN